MDRVFAWLSQTLGAWKFWLVVPPWDAGVRIRLGKRAVALPPGLHLRIPFVDDVVLVNTRARFATPPPVTLTDGDRCRMVSILVGFSILDPLAAMMTFENPRQAVSAFAQAEAAGGTSEANALLALRTRFAPAIEIQFVRYTEDVRAQAIRLMQNQWGIATDDPRPGEGAPVRY